MEKIIFLVLAIPILAYVLYLGGSAIMKGFNAKAANRSEKEEENENNNLSDNKEHLSDELNKLNDLLKSGVLTQEEFEKAKKKILDN
jgi:flagellar hook-basal body complex protein FliE